MIFLLALVIQIVSSTNCFDCGTHMIGLRWNMTSINKTWSKCNSKEVCMELFCKINDARDVSWIALGKFFCSSSIQRSKYFISKCLTNTQMIGLTYNLTMIYGTEKRCHSGDECLESICLTNGVPEVYWILVRQS